jgi:hypothetical protein
MTPFVIATFRAAFPEFANITKFPDAMVTYWADIAEWRLDSRRWGAAKQNGVYLYVAHQITLAAQNVATADVGGASGAQSGPVNSKTVGAVTVAYDTAQTAEEGAGFWNLSTYGKQFYHLVRLFGAGPVQLSGGYVNWNWAR